MQALIDFDGWRKWKDFSAQDKVAADNEKDTASKSKDAAKKKKKANRASLGSGGMAGGSRVSIGEAVGA